MVQGTNKRLASYITRNQDKIQGKKHDQRHLENSLNASLKMDYGISRIGVDVVIKSGSQRAEGAMLTHS